MPTPLRNVRVDDALWSAARQRAERDGTTVTAIVVDALERYVDSDVAVVDDAADEAPRAPA